MIKIDGKAVQVEGRGGQILLELTILLHELREEMDNEFVDVAVDMSGSRAYPLVMALYGKTCGEESALDSLLEFLEALVEEDLS